MAKLDAKSIAVYIVLAIIIYLLSKASGQVPDLVTPGAGYVYPVS